MAILVLKKNFRKDIYYVINISVRKKWQRSSFSSISNRQKFGLVSFKFPDQVPLDRLPQRSSFY